MFQRGTRVIIKDTNELVRILDERHLPGQVKEYWIAHNINRRQWLFGYELGPYWCEPGDELLTEDAPAFVLDQPAHTVTVRAKAWGYAAA